MYANIIHTKRLLCDRTSSFLVWGGVRATTGELWPRNGPRACKTSVFVDFWGFGLRNPGVARIVRPHPDYWTRVLCATSLTGNCQRAEVGLQFSLDVEDHLSATEDAVVHLDTFGSPQRDSACVWRWVVVTSDHIDKSSAWKSLVASCVCSWSSNARFQHICLLRETRSSPVPKMFVSGPAQNAIVASDKRVSSVVWYRIRKWVAEAISLLATMRSSAVWYRTRRWKLV